MTWISPLFGGYQKILKIIFSNLAHIIVGENSKSINNMQTLSWRGLHYSSLFYPFSIEPLYWSKSASQTENISPHSTTQFPLCIGLQVRNVKFWFDVFICITSAESVRVWQYCRWITEGNKINWQEILYYHCFLFQRDHTVSWKPNE